MYIPRSRVCRVRSDEEIVLLVGDEVHPPQVHGLVAAIEANVALFGLARVSWRPDDQPLNVVEDALQVDVRLMSSSLKIAASSMNSTSFSESVSAAMLGTCCRVDGLGST